LIEEEEASMFDSGNKLKNPVLTDILRSLS
jgi:hypothetical protein